MKEEQHPIIELRLWQQFVAVAEHLHFGRAALSLHMTQPPLTQAIAGLEARLGVQLFARTKRNVSLTPAGASLLPAARELLKNAQQLALQARWAASGEVGRLRVGFVSPLGLGPLPGWVREFRSTFPRIALELVEATSDVQQQMLKQSELDAGFVLHTPQFASQLASHGLARLALGQEPMIVALPKQHELARRRAVIRFDQVLLEPLVLFPKRILPSIHDALSALYHAHGQPMQIAQEAIQMQTIVNLVSAGLGIAWVPRTVQQFQRAGVVYRPVQMNRKTQVLCESSLIWREEASDPVLARFVGLVRESVVIKPAA